jgi:6-phosphofructokinase 1
MVEKFAEGANVARDSFGHAQLGGIGVTLANNIKNRLGCKTRGIEFSLMQRCAAHSASLADVNESYLAGCKAAEYAIKGVTDKMVGFKCDRTNGYKCEIELIDLTLVANTEKKFPREWINKEGNGLEKPYIDYALPLIAGEARPPYENGLPRFARLKKIVAK